jgi:hypothetical protein
MNSKYFGKNHHLRVQKPFWAKNGAMYIREGIKGRVIEGQDLYGNVTVEFRICKKRIRERTVVTDYSMYVYDMDFTDYK